MPSNFFLRETIIFNGMECKIEKTVYIYVL